MLTKLEMESSQIATSLACIPRIFARCILEMCKGKFACCKALQGATLFGTQVTQASIYQAKTIKSVSIYAHLL
jgi:hypothetical protein